MSLSFKVLGQEGSMPKIGLGTATLFGDKVTTAVRDAIRLGYRCFDTALLYDNQAAVGRGINDAIAAGEVTREELFITTKVAAYPGTADPSKGTWVPIAFVPENRKGFESTSAAIDLCLKLLGLSYVDLVLVHNATTNEAEYHASMSPHSFELQRSGAPLTPAERKLIMSGRLAAANAAYDAAGADAALSATWRALEEARVAGKARFIGVSNYTCSHLRAMRRYVTVMPCVNQLELHPRYACPAMRAIARDYGMALTAYGTGNSAAIEKSPVVAKIAAARGSSAQSVHIAWTLARGAAVIPRTATPAHMAENLAEVTSGAPLSAADLAALDALDEDYPYYWWAPPLLAPGENDEHPL